MRLVLLALVALGLQASTRIVVLTWTASTTTNVIGYNVYRGATTAGPFALLNSSVVVGTNYTDTADSGQTYVYQVVAVSPVCTPTTPNNVPCGVSFPATAITNVPPPPARTTMITVTVQ